MARRVCEVTVYICSCFGITEQQVRDHAASGACTPRDIATQSRAGTDCGSCVRRIQGILGRGAPCPRRAEALRESGLERVQAEVATPSDPSTLPARLVPAAASAAARMV